MIEKYDYCYCGCRKYTQNDMCTQCEQDLKSLISFIDEAEAASPETQYIFTIEDNMILLSLFLSKMEFIKPHLITESFAKTINELLFNFKSDMSSSNGTKYNIVESIDLISHLKRL